MGASAERAKSHRFDEHVQSFWINCAEALGLRSCAEWWIQTGTRIDRPAWLLYANGMSFPIRSPRDPVGGISVFGRILDKIRLNAQGKLPTGYNVGVIGGKRTFDDRVCKLLGVSYDALVARTLQGGTDEEILEWCFQNGRRPDAEQVELFNGFMSKRGWRDAASEGLVKQRADAGLAHREDLVTFFDVMDVEEGRLP